MYFFVLVIFYLSTGIINNKVVIFKDLYKLYKVPKNQHFWCTLSEGGGGSEKRVLFVHL